MKKSRSNQCPHYFAGIVLVLALLACSIGRRGTRAPVPPVAATPDIGIPGISGVVLFRDDFQDGQVQDWRVTAGWFVQQSRD